MQRQIRSFAPIALILLLFAAFILPSSTTPVNAQRDSSAVLEFSAQDQVLGFRTRDWFVSNGMYLLRVAFVGAKEVTPTSATAKETPGTPPLARVTYPNLWNGIDVTFRATPNGIVESVYQIDPHADPSAIRLRYNAPLTLNSNGTLTTRFDAGEIIESAPIAWQEINGKHTVVPVQFAIENQSINETSNFSPPVSGPELGFAVGAYDPSAPLFIDPTVTWLTTIVTTSSGNGIAVDGSGVYVAGAKSSGDAFAAKLDAVTGVILWITSLGGTGTDVAHGVAVAGGAVYVTGSSDATWGSPINAYNAGKDTFVVKLDATTGLITWNTFLGTSNDDAGFGIAADGTDIYAAGQWDTDNGFAAKLNGTTGIIMWLTILGGTGTDVANGVAVAGGAVYVTGSSDATWGTSPVNGYVGNLDVFVAKLDATTGLITWNTFLGTSNDDAGFGIAADGTDIYVAGQWETDNGFAVKFSDPTTAVNVTGVKARLDSNGKIVVKWHSTTESQIAGFNIYRKNGKNAWTRINQNFKQAKHAGDAAGAKYHFTNRTVKAGKTYRYKIQVVYLDNHTEWTNVVKVKSP